MDAAMTDQPMLYTTVVTVWQTETEAIHIPVLGVFATKDAAERNAQLVALYALAEQRPELLEKPTTTLAVPQPDSSVIALLKALAEQRPDLAQHAQPAKVKRGKA